MKMSKKKKEKKKKKLFSWRKTTLGWQSDDGARCVYVCKCSVCVFVYWTERRFLTNLHNVSFDEKKTFVSNLSCVLIFWNGGSHVCFRFFVFYSHSMPVVTDGSQWVHC